MHDKDGQAITYAYFDKGPGSQTATCLFARDEARRIAANIVKLTELPRKP